MRGTNRSSPRTLLAGFLALLAATGTAAVFASVTDANVVPVGGLPGYQGSTTVAVNPADPLQIVLGAGTAYADPAKACDPPPTTSGSPTGTVALFGTRDGGATWTYNCGPWPADATGGVPGAVTTLGGHPVVAWDGSGNAYAAYMLISYLSSSYGSVSSAVVVARSADAGASWQPLGVIVNKLSAPNVFETLGALAVDATSGGAYSHTGRLYAAWDENLAVRVGRSDTGLSGSWNTAVLDPGYSGTGERLAVGADGTVYAVWTRLHGTVTSESGEQIYFSKSADGGRTWSAPAKVAAPAILSLGSGSSANQYPPAQNKRGVNAFGSLAVDTCPTSPFAGTVYVAYCDFAPGVTSGADMNVYVTRSTDGGATWSARLAVNDDAGGATQFLPWCAVDPSNGALNVAWYDTRNDPANRRVDVYYALSTDGGLSFGPNRQATWPAPGFYNASITYSDENSNDNPDYNASQYGDYMGVGAAGGKAFVAWTDTRQYFPQSPTGAASLAEDVAFAALDEAPSTCSLQCSATVPATAVQGLAADFDATAAATGCTGSPTYDWDFGDGSPHGGSAAATHTYTAPGSYGWTLTVSADGKTCTQSGTLTVTVGNPPVVTAVSKVGSPFRLIATGSNLQDGIQVAIDGAPWADVKWKNTGKVVLKGGGSLKALVPKGVPTPVTFTNPDGLSTTYTVTW